jgi:hypothetical protein
LVLFMHVPDLAVPAATHTVAPTLPTQMPSHLKPAPHAAAPAAVTSVHDRRQNFPRSAMLHAEYSAQREFGQSVSEVHCFSHALKVAL